MGAKNPEAFKPDGGHIWTSGEKGNIYKDNFYYVPQDFSWLGNQFKGVKSLVTGIGLKITDITGEKFNKDMTGISFKERRNDVAKKHSTGGNNVFTRKAIFERVAYYKPDKKSTWGLGKGTCAIEIKVENQPVYLFVGVAEVTINGGQGKGYRWSFQRDKFFNDDYNCGILMKNNSNGYRLVVDRIGRAGTDDQNKGDEVILLGAEKNGIMNFGNSKNNKPLIGVLMGVAVNLAWGNECDSAFNGKIRGENQFEEVKKCLGEVEGRVKKSGELNVGTKKGSTEKLDEGWVKGQLKNSLKNWNKIVRMNSVKNGTELAYTYK